MRILIEEHQYTLTDARLQHDLKCIFKELGGLEDVDGKVSINYVGYYYSAALKDCVFILPKVLMGSDDGRPGLAFGEHRPEDIVDIDHGSPLTEEQRHFLYEFAIWIYRAIEVYRQQHQRSGIIYYKHIAEMSRGRRRVSNTFLDVLLSLIRFNKENQDFFFFTLKEQHAGLNKINWRKTIATGRAVVQSDTPTYLNPVNQRRQADFDEELLAIFFSILNHINDTYGFAAAINVNLPLLPKPLFDNYLRGMGKTRLRQIKYRYFSDRAVMLWELCHAFFDRAHRITISGEVQEYLLAKDFNIVFEAIIDELVGDRLPPQDRRLRQLKEQPDGKLVDHLYQWQDLTNDGDTEKTAYYIGDSKYYRRGSAVGRESVYKQFTYARNVIQWNLDLFNDGTDAEKAGHVMLRDDLTEGYNVIPNFFISAQQNTLKKEDDIHLTDRRERYYFSRQFENRLFDRDTLLVAHYDVNFLFVVALYGRNNAGEKAQWKKKVRDMFRHEIQQMLKEKFLFYALTPHENVNADAYLRENFRLLLGKVFRPFDDAGGQQYLSLALRNPAAITKPEERKLREQIETENEGIRQVIDQYFYRAECELGADPATLDGLPKVQPGTEEQVPAEFRTKYFFEAFMHSTFLIGCYKDSDHLRWIFGRDGKRDSMYNIRIDRGRDGSVPKHKARKAPAFLLLYSAKNPTMEGLMAFKIHNAADTPYAFMKKTHYPGLKEGRNYVSYILEPDPITFGEIDITALLDDYRADHPDHKKGEPIFLPGEAVIRYRRQRP